MSSWKCAQCGLVNFADARQCQRCGAVEGASHADEEAGAESQRGRSVGQRVWWIVGMLSAILVICYASLLLTSDPATRDQRQTVERAVALLEQRGLTRETFVLRHLVNYRTTDNWWNLQVGHENAYAATNFPFEVVTLYPEFFQTAQDDTERAVILLHESFHLSGAGEPAALAGTWRTKAKLGWTEEQYAGTKLWRNTKEL
ncbi:MAG: zinc finger Ran-binding domain-containing protein, partial [Acidobacteriota bacterium]|nr:zinc finger Ran-binding domain-containing protein [Acidobacteriota bacterium]